MTIITGHTYMKHTYPNVFVDTSEHTDIEGEDWFVEMESMKVLTSVLSKKFPAYQFTYTDLYASAVSTPHPVYTSTNITITSVQQHLGYIQRAYKHGGYNYVLMTESIANASRRGRGKATADPARMVPLIRKYCIIQGDTQLVKKAENLAVSLMASLADIQARAVDTALNGARRSISATMLNRDWDGFAKWVEWVEPTIILPDFPATRAKHEITSTMKSQLSERGLVVYINPVNNTYLVNTLSPDCPHASYTTNSLPMRYKEAVGMLKLVEDGTFVTGTGLRVNKDTFYILPKEGSDDNDC